MEKFSVLMSVYYKDDASYLQDSLDSIFEQTTKADEVVLVEDGPLTPDLYAVINHYSHMHKELKILPLQKNGGLGKALNEGLKHCSYDVIARMDADDIAKPERFRKQLEVMEIHPEYDLVGSWIDEFVDRIEHVTSFRKVPEMPDENIRYAKSRCPVNHPTVMYRKQAIFDAGCYQTKYFPEDYFLWIRMLQNGAKIYNIQESLLWFRYSPETFKRRGGWKYAIDEVKTQLNIYRLGFINIPTLMKNVAIRFTTRVMPNNVRGIVYKMIRKG